MTGHDIGNLIIGFIVGGGVVLLSLMREIFRLRADNRLTNDAFESLTHSYQAATVECKSMADELASRSRQEESLRIEIKRLHDMVAAYEDELDAKDARIKELKATYEIAHQAEVLQAVRNGPSTSIRVGPPVTFQFDGIGSGEKCFCHQCCKDRDERSPGSSWLPYASGRMIVCAICGNKRCPRATDHRNECTNSNEPGQIGSIFGGLNKPDGRSIDSVRGPVQCCNTAGHE